MEASLEFLYRMAITHEWITRKTICRRVASNVILRECSWRAMDPNMAGVQEFFAAGSTSAAQDDNPS
jgi:hypothetical protein